jgi:bacterioferritin
LCIWDPASTCPGKKDFCHGAFTHPKTGSHPEQSFLMDVRQLRAQARANMNRGALIAAYQGDLADTLAILQAVLATELVCVLRYTMNAVAAICIASEGVKAEFEIHPKEQQEHMMRVAERINQLGGTPTFSPEGLAARSASEYIACATLVDMIRETLVAERSACDHYTELIRYFADRDPATRLMMESILLKEEEHANDMHDLLVAHEGTPMLPGK